MRNPSRRRGINYRHIGRYVEIIRVLVKYGFGDLLSRLEIDRYLGKNIRFVPLRRATEYAHIPRWDRIRMSLEELGPTFIKLGQFMSNRADVLPMGLIAALERLQDSVPSFPVEESRAIIEHEMERSIPDIFDTFIDTPIASASIAQVHRATLKTGEDVAVKVMRPRVEQSVELDCDILNHLASLFDRVFQDGWGVSLVQIAGEFEHAMRKELDFTIEVSHIAHFANNFRNDPTVHVPHVHRQLSSKRVLVTEFIDGIKSSDVAAVERAGLDRRLIAERGARIILKQVFEHGFFHADPHPGNILIMPGNVICFLDFGMTGVLSVTQRQHLGAAIVGIVSKDTKRIIRALLNLSKRRVEDVDALEYEITELIEEYSYLQLKDINVGEVLNRVLRIIAAHRLYVIPGFYLLLKSLITIEGVGYQLDPQFNMMTHVEPFARHIAQLRFQPGRFAGGLVAATMDLVEVLQDLPSESAEILRMIKEGRTRIEFHHRGLEPLMEKLDSLVTRVVFAVVLASLIVGSSLMTVANIQPRLYGMPVIGVAGFLVAGVIGFWLLLQLLRRGRM